MHRSSVDFPEPLAPIRHTTSWSSTVEVDAREDLELIEPLVDALRPGATARHATRSGLLPSLVATDQPVDEAAPAGS